MSSNGNILLRWSGRDVFNDTPAGELRYQMRLDENEWMPWSERTDLTYTELSVGSHRFEVRTADRDGNIDPTPAIHTFTVEPPWWRNPWVVLLSASLFVLAVVQTIRTIQGGRRLSLSNANLRSEISEHERAEAERSRLDVQLEQLRYLDRLRSALEPCRSTDATLNAAGSIITEVLSDSGSSGVRIHLDANVWASGQLGTPGKASYTRPLAWGGKERGRLELSTSTQLNETQERALLDETAGQLSRALEARELEMQLVQSARLVSLGQMAAGVAHELNQPLSVISTTAGDIYQRHLEGMDLPPERLKSMMTDILEVVEHLEETIDHLRVFSRDTSAEPGVLLDLNEVVRSSMKMIGAQLQNHGIRVELSLADGLPTVSGHPHRLEQIFLNLLANARDALTMDGRVSEDREKRIVIRTTFEEGDVPSIVAEFEDSGAGMDKETREHLFEPFYTTKDANRGTGLGLSISYAIVQDHEGTITCQSREGVGTTFRVVLPVETSS